MRQWVRAGRCIPNGYNVQVLGYGNLSFSYIEADGPPPAYIVFVGPDSTVALVAATIDASGVNWGVRNRDGQLYIAYTTISNAALISIETLAGVTEVFGPVVFGDDDDSAKAASVGFGGVLYLQEVGTFGVPTTVTLKSSGTALRVHDGGTAAVAEVGTELFATGADIEVETGGVLRLNMKTTFELSNKLKVANGGYLEVAAQANQQVSINGDLQIVSGSVDFDFDESPGGSLVHRGNVSVELNGSLSINGNPADSSLVKVAMPDDADPLNGTTLSAIGQATIAVKNAELHHAVTDMARSMFIIDDESSLIGGLTTLLSDLDSTILFVNGEPSAPIICQRGGSAWNSVTSAPHCQ